MSAAPDPAVREATADELPAVARLLEAFNREYDEPSPEPAWIAERLRSLLEATIAHARRRGADHMDLGTSEDDVAARALYTRMGFTNREHPPDGPVMYVFERKL